MDAFLCQRSTIGGASISTPTKIAGGRSRSATMAATPLGLMWNWTALFELHRLTIEQDPKSLDLPNLRSTGLNYPSNAIFCRRSGLSQ
jgi:hypothetical protein